MEAGRNQDPGSLSPEDELGLLELDKAYREIQTGETFPSRTKEGIFYLMAHRPPGSTDIEDPDYSPNHYMFFVMGLKDHERREKHKVFILFLGKETGNYVRVVNTAELQVHHEQELGLSEDDIYNRPELTQEFWKAVETQGDLGTAVPNQEDMEDFADIADSWHQAAKSKGW